MFFPNSPRYAAQMSGLQPRGEVSLSGGAASLRGKENRRSPSLWGGTRIEPRPAVQTHRMTALGSGVAQETIATARQERWSGGPIATGHVLRGVAARTEIAAILRDGVACRRGCLTRARAPWTKVAGWAAVAVGRRFAEGERRTGAAHAVVASIADRPVARATILGSGGFAAAPNAKQHARRYQQLHRSRSHDCPALPIPTRITVMLSWPPLPLARSISC